MAIVYPNAELVPGKRDVMDAWLPSRPWFDGETGRKPTGLRSCPSDQGRVGSQALISSRLDGVRVALG